MKYINLTDHDVTICDDYGNMIFKIPPSGTQARLVSNLINCEYFNEGGFVLKCENYGETTIANLPPPEDGVIYITSTLVAMHARRMDIVSPNTQKALIRDNYGNIEGVTSFQRFLQ